MKKSRLLEIIREEISTALREGEAEERAAKAAELKAIDAKQKALDAERKDTMKGGALEEDRYEKVVEGFGKLTSGNSTADTDTTATLTTGAKYSFDDGSTIVSEELHYSFQSRKSRNDH